MSAKSNITIEQGADFNLSVTVQNSSGVLNFTGYTGASQIRKSSSDATALASFTCTFNTPPTDGIINLSMTAATTATLPVSSNLLYDLLITDGSGIKTRVLEGVVVVSPWVTR